MRTAWYGLAVVVMVATLPLALGATLAASVNDAAVGLSRGLHLRGVRAGREAREKKLTRARRTNG